jgi:hypothetical protein
MTPVWHPIPFTDPLVLAVREGRKTVTRRPFRIERAKLRPIRTVRPDFPFGFAGLPGGKCADAIGGKLYKVEMNPFGAVSAIVRGGDKGWTGLGMKPHEYEWVSPWGAPGDLLWIRECTKLRAKGGVPGQWTWFDLAYRADGEILEFKYADLVGKAMPYKTPDKTVPPMFMPRWASRTSLKLVSVRVEKLQAISEADACAEGMAWGPSEDITTPGDTDRGSQVFETKTPRAMFAETWDKIYGKGAWGRNGWVWRLEFNLLEKP